MCMFSHIHYHWQHKFRLYLIIRTKKEYITYFHPLYTQYTPLLDGLATVEPPAGHNRPSRKRAPEPLFIIILQCRTRKEGPSESSSPVLVGSEGGMHLPFVLPMVSIR